jgi:glycosyltransferase involved in cell wall biosynthesis
MNVNDKLFCVVSAPVASRSGYGDHSRDCIRGLIEKYPNWDIKIIPQRWGATPLNALTEGIDDDLLTRLWLQQQLPQQPDVWMQITVPNEFNPIGKFNIGVTAGIETTAADGSFIEGINKMDLTLVPSKFTKDVLLNSKYQKVDKNTNQPMGTLQVEKPIEIVFEGLDLNVWKKPKSIPKSIADEIKQIPESFCYLMTGHWLQGDPGQDRKDIGMLVKVFMENFKDTTNAPALVLKTSSATFSVIDRNECIKKIEGIRRSVSGKTPNVYLLHGDLSPEEMNALYNHPKMKAMVSFTKGEGYGRPLAEFARTGKPVLASNWSGHVDFLNPKYHILLPGQLTPVHKSAVQKGMINEGTQWFTVDYPMAGGILKEVHKNYKKYAEKSRGSAHYMKTEFSLDKMNDVMKEVIDKSLESKPQQTSLNLPKLKKVDSTSEKPTLKLPKLKKVTK